MANTYKIPIGNEEFWEQDDLTLAINFWTSFCFLYKLQIQFISWQVWEYPSKISRGK